MLEARDITVQIGDKTLVDRVNLKLEPGSFCAVLGKNGAGKSTLLKTLTGDIHPISGQVCMEGTLLSHIKPLTLARKRAVMMQNTQLPFAFTAFEVVLMGRTPHTRGFETHDDRRIAMSCMAETGVDHLASRSYPTLSGGEKQRVQLARILAQLHDAIENADPCYLLLDEPLSSLDMSHQHTLMHHIRRLTQRNVAVLMILHDLNLAAQYADEVTILKDGRLYALGTPDEVFRPELIGDAFDCPVHILRHPEFDCPLVISTALHGKTMPSTGNRVAAAVR